MRKRFELFNIAELEEGGMRRAEVGGKGILVARMKGELYAIGDKCTHMGCSLSEGQLEESVVTCRCHGTRFDITSGKVIEWVSKYPLIGKLTSFMKKDEPVYEISVEEGKVVIFVSEG
ncbi:MAG: Rieske (2Fe-2S) protein [Candidatus Brocadiales bacterium]